jgi:prefoldin subunit 5
MIEDIEKIHQELDDLENEIQSGLNELDKLKPAEKNEVLCRFKKDSVFQVFFIS